MFPVQLDPEMLQALIADVRDLATAPNGVERLGPNLIACVLVPSTVPKPK